MDSIVKAIAAQAFTEINIKSDGTTAGTTITVNGKEIKNLTELNFGYRKMSYWESVSLDYSIRDPDYTPGTLSETRRLVLVPPNPEDAKGTATLREATLEEESGCVQPLGSLANNPFAKL